MPDVAGYTRPESDAVQVPANGLPKETHAERPTWDPPRNPKGLPQAWQRCRNCSHWFAAPRKVINRGCAVYCSRRCCAEHFTATGKFRGEKNPSWLGGVSNDNMRYRNRQKEREPAQEAARRTTYNAIKSGKLVRQPCEVCGVPKSEAHHDDYSKPLDVRWLCRTHHVEHHKRERGAA